MRTVGGKRLLFSRLMAPSTSLLEINARLDSVEGLHAACDVRTRVREHLRDFFDLEKLVALACAQKISPRGLAHIRNSLLVVDQLKSLPHSAVRACLSLHNYDNCKMLLERALADEPPVNLKDGGVIKPGYDQELDGLTDLITNGKELLLALESREREATKITSLKIKYTRVFGYYIEITKTNLDKVPAHYQRKQTIANGERFVTKELIELEGKLASAEEKAQAVEERHFVELRHNIIEHAATLLAIAKTVADLDVTASFAEQAEARSWVRPRILEAGACTIDIKSGRHPLVEELLQNDGHYFVPNDVRLDENTESIALITGPNMAGKSTIMRMVALTQIMAQLGCFVPAESATLSICDAVFARVGASDDPAKGRSTFMVEMTEAAAILSNATPQSLIILDEIGRGTSTYDGMSIAQAVCEHIHDQLRARTLFATHYHELTKLEEPLARLKNYHVGVLEQDMRHRLQLFLYVRRQRASSNI